MLFLKPHTKDLFRFWQTIEAMTPQDAVNISADNKYRPTYSLYEKSCPWSIPHQHLRSATPQKKKWRYHVQSALYESERLNRLIKTKLEIRSEKIIENMGIRHSRLFDFTVDENGVPIAGSFTLSMAGWTAGVILYHGICRLELVSSDVRGLASLPEDKQRTRSGFPAFDDLSDHLCEEFDSRVRALNKTDTSLTHPIDGAWVNDFARIVIEKCRLPQNDLFGEPLKHRVLCVLVTAQADKEDEPEDTATESMLNSFYVEELGHLASSNAELSRPLDDFLFSLTKKIPHTDIRSARGLDWMYNMMAPSKFPQSKWPSRFPLVFSQQIAVNSIRHFFLGKRNRNESAPSVFAVNGPPGTGKTTLLKDIIAAAIVDRARILSDLSHPRNAFLEEKNIPIGKYVYKFKHWIPSLSGMAIVVASSNNGAVENISMELPILEPQERMWSQEQDVDYFRELAQKVVGEDAWALLATRLGNKSNRSEFLSKFWFGERNENPSMGDSIPSCKNGMMSWLKDLREGKATPGDSWANTVKRFRKALDDEKSIRTKYQQYFDLSDKINQSKISLQNADIDRNAAKQKLEKAESVLKQISVTLDSCNKQAKDSEKRFRNILAMKPGFWENLLSLGSTMKDWRDQIGRAHKKLTFAEEVLKTRQSEIINAEKFRNECAKSLDLSEKQVKKQSDFLVELKKSLSQAKEQFGRLWPDTSLPDEERELVGFWSTEDWRKAQIEVFISALSLHRSFIENVPDEMYKNLSLTAQWLQGKRLPEDLAQLSLDSLTMVVPVISSTFASFGRMMKNIPNNGIGWLLIDEAGQACPQHATGALQRAKRAVVVGDPLQLEPVTTISQELEKALANVYGIDKPWWPSMTSVQAMADQANPIGTCLPGNGFSTTCQDGSIWVGSPLRVHRRCDDPMFSVSNQIAYGGLMVHGKTNRLDPRCKLPPSGWIHVDGKTSEGHWVHDEGLALEVLLKKLIHEYLVPASDIFLISPFKTVVSKLYDVGKIFDLEKKRIGTVHTTQGKESVVVILVLGGDPQKHGAKDWAAQKPNLLNVAASRAKNRLYIIGNNGKWGKCNYFNVAIQYLQKIEQTGVNSQIK